MKTPPSRLVAVQAVVISLLSGCAAQSAKVSTGGPSGPISADNAAVKVAADAKVAVESAKAEVTAALQSNQNHTRETVEAARDAVKNIGTSSRDMVYITAIFNLGMTMQNYFRYKNMRAST